VLPASVDIQRSDWAPRICFVFGATCAQSLTFDHEDPDLDSFTPHVWVVGDKEETVTLTWEIWDAADGWRSHGETAEASPLGLEIDPENPPPMDQLAEIDLPFKNKVGQAVLYAMRSFRLPGDACDREVRSNPLLVSLYGTGS
jgi:hypothetical protein